ncbi:LysR family transcriptional regulator [Peptoniphilus catoniae]|uniref:LysR family transcriptional regulator n=1 Tax=Peptoniphilus catoniae TaxID=1660341 RepID=UPI0015D621B6|nr:LysR family transcriptional regulator [Peptoniphilus catoniae]
MNKKPEYFITIVKEKSITKAAEKLFVSQPYLSQYVSRLESELDTKLLDRSKSPIELTEAGRIYYNYLTDSSLLDKKLLIELDNINKKRSYTINIGFSPWRGSTLLPDIFPEFSRRHPNIQIVLHEHPVNEMEGLISDNKIDFAIINSTLNIPKDMNLEVISYEDIKLAANLKNPLTQKILNQSEKGSLNPLDLIEDERFILLKPGLIISNKVHDYFEKIKFVPNEVIYTTNNTTALNLVAANMGFSFIVSAKKGTHKNGGLVFIDLKSKDLLVPLVVLYKKNSYISPAARDFIDIAKHYYNS